MTRSTMLILKTGESRTKRLSAFHQSFQNQNSGIERIPLGKVHAKAHSPRFFAPDQYISGQHFRRDVFETHS